MLKKPVQINKWASGIGTSPHTGFQEMYNMDIFSIDGVIKPNFQLFPQADTPITATATFSTNVVTASTNFSHNAGTGNISPEGRAVRFTAGAGNLGNIVAGTTYFIKDINGTSFNISATINANGTAGSTFVIGSASGTVNIFSIDAAQLNYFAYNRDTNLVYGQDKNGLIWVHIGGWWVELPSQPTLTGAAGNGLIVWKNYLCAFRQGEIDFYGPLNATSPTWVATLNLISNTTSGVSTIQHFPFIATDTFLYWADISFNSVSSVLYTIPYLGNIQEVSGMIFDPTNSGTYTLSTQKLAFPASEIITAINQQGNNLMVGTILNHIYPWDRSSATYSLPIWTAEKYVHSMVNINAILYFSCGNKGNLYKTYGTYAVKILDFSDYLSGFPQFTVFETQLAAYQSRLIFSISGNASSANDQVSGIYSMSLESGSQGAGIVESGGGEYLMDFIPSGGAGVSINDILVASEVGNAANPDKDTEFNVFIAWNNINTPSTVGIDGVTANGGSIGPQRAIGSKAVAISQLYQVGDVNQPQTLEKFLIHLGKPLVVGESIIISFKANDLVGGSFTNPVTFTSSSDSVATGLGLQGSVNLENVIWIQCKIIMNAADGAGSPVYDGPEIRLIELY